MLQQLLCIAAHNRTLTQKSDKNLMVYLLLASSHVWISVRADAVSLPLEQPAPKVELLGVLLVQLLICFIILEGEALHTNTTVTYDNKGNTTRTLSSHQAKCEYWCGCSRSVRWLVCVKDDSCHDQLSGYAQVQTSSVVTSLQRLLWMFQRTNIGSSFVGLLNCIASAWNC